MTRESGIRLAMVILAGSLASPVAAQDNLDRGKSGAQLYASNCAICHKSVQGLAKAGGIFGVEGFLREHYTASRESAAVIAAYLRSVDTPARPDQRKQTPRRAARGDAKPDSKPDTAAKPADKPAEKKPDAAPAQDVIKLDDGPPAKPVDSKPAAAVDTKPAEPKASEAPADPKPAAPKSE